MKIGGYIHEIITFDKNLAWSIGRAVACQFRSCISYRIFCSRLVINYHLYSIWGCGRHGDLLVRGWVGGGESEGSGVR